MGKNNFHIFWNTVQYVLLLNIVIFLTYTTRNTACVMKYFQSYYTLLDTFTFTFSNDQMLYSKVIYKPCG